MNPEYSNFQDKVSINEAEELLSRLISISSVNPYDRENYTNPPFGEAHLASFVAGYMKQIGCQISFQEVLPGRENLIATIPGGRDGGALLLEAHLDTVHVDNMIIEPFTPVVRAGRLFGRGASDTKGSLAAMMLALKLVNESGYKPYNTVHFAATVDEEYKWRGVSQLINSDIRVDAGIVGEPTNLDIVIAHKGSVRWKVITRGHAVHSSSPEKGINAINKMAEVIIAINSQIGAKYAAKKHPLVGAPTLSIGIIAGGTEVNTVPNECAIHIDRRLLPGEEANDAINEIREILDELCQKDRSLDIIVEDAYLIDLPLEVSEHSPVVKCISRASRLILGNSNICGVPYGSNASKIAAAGVPCIVFGPGSIIDAHSADESIELWQVKKAAEVLAEAVTSFSAT